jgi:hypothetical protein
MKQVTWTGHPFVDAGLSAIAAVVGVKRLEDLKVEHLEKAAKELEHILLSDQALGIGVERAFRQERTFSTLSRTVNLLTHLTGKGKRPK